MHRTRHDLPENRRSDLVRLLNDRLADVLDLHLQAKTAHWNVRGPDFFQLHELFDKVADSAEEHADLLAERAGTLAGTAEGTVQAVSKNTSLPPYPLNLSAGRDHVDALAGALAAVAKQMRAAIDRADELGDKDTADLFTGYSRTLDKYLWFLEAHLQADK